MISGTDRTNLAIAARAAAKQFVADVELLDGAARLKFGSGLICLISSLRPSLPDDDALIGFAQHELQNLKSRFLDAEPLEWGASSILVAARCLAGSDTDELWRDERRLASGFLNLLSSINAENYNVSLADGWAGAVLALKAGLTSQLIWKASQHCSDNSISLDSELSMARGVAGMLCALCATTAPFVAVDPKRALARVLWKAIKLWRKFEFVDDLSLDKGATGLAVAGLVAGLNLGCDGLKDDSLALLVAVSSKTASRNISAATYSVLQDIALAFINLAPICSSDRLFVAGNHLARKIIRFTLSDDHGWFCPWEALATLTLSGLADSQWLLPCKGIPDSASRITTSRSCILQSIVTLVQPRPITLGFLHLGACYDSGTSSDDYQEFFSLVQMAEELGFDFFWLGEHWVAEGTLWSSPLPLISALLERTKRIRIGSAGLMLKYHNLVRLATEFNLLEHVFCGRVDLGVVPSSPANMTVRKSLESADSFPIEFEARLRVLLCLLRGTQNDELCPEGLEIGPVPVRSPQIWLLGTGNRSLKCAANLGLAYAHSIVNSLNSSHDALAVYKDLLSKVEIQSTVPRPKLTVAGSCAETMEDALANISNNPTEFAYPIVIGSPTECATRLCEIQLASGVDDFVFLELATTQQHRRESLRLLGSGVLARRAK